MALIIILLSRSFIKSLNTNNNIINMIMPELFIFEFMLFYFGMSIALTVIFFLFKTVLKNHWFLYIPLIFAGIIFFPFGLILLGYCLRIYDERRNERRFFVESDPMSEDFDSAIIDPNVKW